jgi:hypothetical protein
MRTVIQHRAWSSLHHKPATSVNYCPYPAQDCPSLQLNKGGPTEIAIKIAADGEWVAWHGRSMNQVSFLRQAAMIRCLRGT